MATKGAGGKLVCQTCNSSCELCELTSDRKVSEKVASFKRAHQTLQAATCKGCRIVYSECRLCNHCNDYLCGTCSRAHCEIYSSILLSRLISLRMRYRRLLRYAEKDEYRQDPELMGLINRYKATIESALSRAEVFVESLDAVLSENMENVFPASSTNASKQESGDLWSVRQVDEVISSGGQMVMKHPLSSRLPSRYETAQNTSTRPLPPKEASGPVKSWSHIHTAMSFVLSRNKSKNPRPSNDAILGHFRQFGNVVQFHCYSCAHGYVDYSCHDEALSALNESIQELEGWLVKPHPIKAYPQGLTELAKTFTVLYFQLSMSTPKRKPPSDEDLKEHLSRFGRITHFQYLLNPPCGYVEYSSHSEAKKALSEPIHEVGTWILHSHPIKQFPASELVLEPGTSWRFIHTSIGFELLKNNSSNPRPSNGAILRHFRRFGNVIRFHCYLTAHGYVDYSSHEEALNALTTPLQEIDGWLVAPRPMYSYPRCLIELAETFRVLNFELSMTTSKGLPPSDEDLKRHLSGFGNIIRFEYSSSPPRGCVEYETNSEAKKALSEPNHHVGAWILYLQPTKEFPAAYLQPDNSEIPPTPREVGNTSNAVSTPSEGIGLTTPHPPSTETVEEAKVKVTYLVSIRALWRRFMNQLWPWTSSLLWLIEVLLQIFDEDRTAFSFPGQESRE